MEKVDVHKVITTLFNVELNEFLAKFDKEKVFETVRTGGLMEVRISEAHPFKQYIEFLRDFREELLYPLHPDYTLDVDSFQKAMEPLLEFYVNLEIFSVHNVFAEELETDLINYLLKPFLRFLYSLDEHLKTTYFSERVNELKRLSPEMTIRVVNLFSLPISKVEAQISWVRLPEIKEYSKTIPLCTIKTDESGMAKTKLTGGHYRIDVGRYKKRLFLDLSENKEVEVKVFDLLNLLKHVAKKLH